MHGWFGKLFSGSLRMQLIAGVALLHIALMSVFAFDVVQKQRELVRGGTRARVTLQARMLAISAGQMTTQSSLQEYLARYAEVPGVNAVMVTDVSRAVVAQSSAASLGPLGRIVAASTEPNHFTDRPALVFESRDRFVATAPLMRAGEVIGQVWVEGGIIAGQSYLAAIARSGIIYVVVATGLATLFTWLFASALVGQLRQLHLAASRLSSDRLDAPVPVTVENEIGQVLHAFNRAMQRLGEQREELTRTRDQIQAAMAASSTGTYRWDLRSDRFEGDANLQAVFGLEPSGAFRHINDFTSRIHAQDIYNVQYAFDQCRLENSELSHEFRVVRPDGTVRWVLNNGKIVRDAAGMPRMLIGACTDVTALRVSEQALRDSEHRFRTLGEAVPQMIWVCDAQGRTQFCNERLRRYLGIPSEEGDSAAWYEHIHPDDLERAQRLWAESIRDGKAYDCEFRMCSSTGESRWFLTRAIPMRRKLSDEINHWVGTCTDIHDQKQSEEALKTVNDTLEMRIAERTAEVEFRAEQLRRMAAEMTQIEQRERRRLAQVLHDHLQQMLVAARMQMSLLVSQLGRAPAAGAAERVDALIKESIDVSRSLTVELSPPVLYDANLAVAFEWLSRQMRKKHDLDVVLETDPDAEPQDEETRVFLFQAARELLFNVVKHADVQQAKISLARLGEDGLEVCVEDGGKGFDPASLVGGGTDLQGFGLFSIQERLELIGGEMIVDGGPGQGTRVRLIAPIEQASRTATPQHRLDLATGHHEPQPAAPKPRSRQDRQGRLALLLVDDHKILREGLAGLLKQEPDIDIVGHAADGAQAVELARELGPDVIIMDITMPVMSGIDATRQIMEQLPGCRVIGLSMHEDREMEMAMRSAGAIAYLTKGGPADQLLSAIRQEVPAAV